MRAVLLGMLFLLPLLSGLAMADENNTFTVVVDETHHRPSVVEVEPNVTVMYVNVDNRENITHRIGLDLNADGDFDDAGEFGSGILNHTCDWDVDPECRVAWILNETFVGEFHLTDYASDGVSKTVWLNVSTEHHHANEEHPGPVAEEVETTTQSGQTDLQKAMLLGGMMLFGGALLLMISMVMERQ